MHKGSRINMSYGSGKKKNILLYVSSKLDVFPFFNSSLVQSVLV